MRKTDALNDDALPQKLMPLGAYCWPQGETTQTLEHIFELITSKLTWFRSKDAPSPQKLHTFKEQSTIDAAHKRLCGTLFSCLDATYSDWINDPAAAPAARAFVHAPVDQSLLRDWANAREYQVLDHIEAFNPETDDKLIVLPNLETRLLRRDDALADIRDMLAKIAQADVKLIVGCNSWAWRYLISVTSIELAFDRPCTIPAFDAHALASLLKPILAEANDPAKFMSVESDEPIFATDDEGELLDPYFSKLAKRSLGLPWVAIEMFFDDMVSSKNDDGERTDDRTWLKFSTPPKLPSSNTAQLCIALQNLLIHGPSTKERLAELCPKDAPQFLWSALERSGFVEIDGETTRISTSHYPAIRSALSTAGLNLDKL